MSTAPALKSPPWYAGLEPWFLPLALVAWVCGNMGDHAWPGGFRTMWQLLAPALLMFAMPMKKWPVGTSGFAMLLVVPLLVMLAPLGLTGLWANAGHTVHGALHAVALGDAAMVAAAIVLAWSAMSSAASPEHLIARCAAAAGVTLAMAWGAVVCASPAPNFNPIALAFGNVNDLLWMCAPALFGGAAWALTRPDRASRGGRVFAIAMAAALVVMGWISFTAFSGKPRRGVLLAAALVVIFFAFRWAWRKWPRAAWAGAAALFVLTAAILAWVLSDFDPRNDRLLAWSAFWHQGVAHFPLGVGAEPGLRLADEPSEAAMRIEASRQLFLDAHSEFLQCFAAGGIFGLGVMLWIASALTWRIARIADAAQRAAAAAIGIGLLVPALIDLALSRPVGMAWTGILIGVIARCPVVPPAPRPEGATPLPWWRRALAWSRRALDAAPAPRICAVPLALLAFSAAAVDWRAVVLSTQDGAPRRVKVINSTWQTEVALGPDVSNHAAILDSLAYDYANGIFPDGNDLFAADAQLSAVINQVGFTSSALTAAATGARLNAAIVRQDLSGCCGAIAQMPLDIRYWQRAWYDLTAITGFNTNEATALAVLVRRRPFTSEGWQQLDGLLQARPDFIVHPPFDLSDPEVRKSLELRWAQAYLRLRYLRGDVHLPTPDMSAEPKTISAAGDLYAYLGWTLIRFGDWKTIAPALERLVRSHGDCPDVGRLLLRVEGDAHAGELPWMLELAPRVGYGLRHSLPIDTLTEITSRAGAKRVWPLLAAIFPDLAVRAQSAKPDNDPLVEEMARLWILQQDAEH